MSQVGWIPSSPWLLRATLDQPRLSLCTWVDVATQSWIAEHCSLLTPLKCPVTCIWHWNRKTKGSGNIILKQCLRIFPLLLCKLCYKKKYLLCWKGFGPVVLTQLPRMVQWNKSPFGLNPLSSFGCSFVCWAFWILIQIVQKYLFSPLLKTNSLVCLASCTDRFPLNWRTCRTVPTNWNAFWVSFYLACVLLSADTRKKRTGLIFRASVQSTWQSWMLLVFM